MKTRTGIFFVIAALLAGLLSACAGSGTSGSFPTEGGGAAVSQDEGGQTENPQETIKGEPGTRVAFGLEFVRPAIPEFMSGTAARSASKEVPSEEVVPGFNPEEFLGKLEFLAVKAGINVNLPEADFWLYRQVDFANGAGMEPFILAPGEYSLYADAFTVSGVSLYHGGTNAVVEVGKTTTADIPLALTEFAWVGVKFPKMPGKWTTTDWSAGAYRFYRATFTLDSMGGTCDHGLAYDSATVSADGTLNFFLPLRLVRERAEVSPDGQFVLFVRELDPTVGFSFYIQDDAGNIYGGEYALDMDGILEMLEAKDGFELAPPKSGELIIRINTDAPLAPAPSEKG